MKKLCWYSRKPWRVRLINFLFKGTIIMETLETLTAKAVALTEGVNLLSQSQAVQGETLQVVDDKLDEIRTFIQTLSLPQDQLDALGAQLDGAATAIANVQAQATELNTKATTVLAEADALDEPQP